MDQARTTITKIFNGTEGSYTRFLTQNMEEDSSHVEMKLSSDTDEEVGGNGVADHAKQNRARPSHISRSGLCNSRNICIATTVAILASFLIGLLIGSSVYKKTTGEASTSCMISSSSAASTDDETIPIEVVPSLDWSDITTLFKRRLTTSDIDKSLREFSREDHQAGSAGDEILASKVLKKFKGYGMEPWLDTHFVKVQGLPKSGTNKVTFGNVTYSEPGYLSYSATERAQGAVLYVHYGRDEDLRHLQDLSIDMSGRVLLVRAGKISYAEKVANAVKVNASAVLIYPDPADYQLSDNTPLFGHVHLGSGDPYTPGFPSFNHTQFPPSKSSGLPSIPAQTIRASTAAAIMKGMGGRSPPRGWADGGLQEYKLGDYNDIISLEMNNVLTEIQIHNVFGVIKGLIDPDRYVVIGAQRDAWGPGFVTSTVGTSLLLELARVLTRMIHEDGFKPRRSIVFASWSAGEYGAVGATEWLEGYLPSLSMKAFSYISLDRVVTGSSLFKASSSPLLTDLIQSTLKEVSSPTDSSRSLYAQVAGANWEAAVMEPMKMDDAAYPFLAFSGIPSVSFRFTQDNQYPFLGTLLDTRENLERKTSNPLALIKAVGEVAGQMALRLVHDHLLRLNTEKYLKLMYVQVNKINKEVMILQRNKRLPNTLQMKWFMSAIGSYGRAARSLVNTIQNSDLDDLEQCRIINDRIMGVERDLLSPYASPQNTPFRHIMFGSGSCTLEDVLTQLVAIKEGSANADIDLLKNQFALTTWTIQSCANALAGNVWDLDNDL
ncbi:transferrin receptor protein 1-like isoform X2 [Hemibagrus wyckioides]|uniref:transferrin receptor protein 1-like isoform X2 n=1 Tax=Hemibagrus wyckioides TaxID=337641 RepID=UPI00266B8582|nr:transferrin receptor protein 1-like isoform X2 [Hemibagrus wyckioides]